MKSGKTNSLIKSPEDYCDFLYYINDPKLWEMEWHNCRINEIWFMNHWLYIENRDTRKTQLFSLNAIQKKYYAEHTNLDIILKARKMGISTFVSGRFFHKVCFIENMKAFIIAHESTSSEEIFKTIRMFYDLLPPQLRPVEKFNSKRELELVKSPYGHRLNSKYAILTAGAKSAGRGVDADYLHMSEYSSYSNVDEISTAIGQALTRDATVSIESTAKGLNSFYDEYKKAKDNESNYKPFFFSWFDDPEYKREIPEGIKLKLSDKLKKLQKDFNLTDEQIYWYQQKSKEPGMSIYMPQEYPSTDNEAFLMSDDCIFDTDKLIDWNNKAEKYKPIHKLYGGDLLIYNVPKKKIKEGESKPKYIIGADTATGEGNDYSTFFIMDIETREQVASYKGKKSIEEFKKLVYRFALMYNNAKIAPERNFLGYAVIDYLRKKIKYPYIYRYKDPIEKAGKGYKYGFDTNSKTRPILIADMLEALENDLVLIKDNRIISEMKTFVKKESGKIEHQDGCNDDLLFSLMISIYVANREIKLAVA